MKKLEWYVFTEDCSGQSIRKFNVFDHYGFLEDLKQNYKKNKNDFDTFSTELKRSLRYYYWSKCEWEIVLSDWPPSERFNKEKVDVYDQVMLNWGVFVKYVWDRCHMRKNAKE